MRQLSISLRGVRLVLFAAAFSPVAGFADAVRCEGVFETPMALTDSSLESYLGSLVRFLYEIQNRPASTEKSILVDDFNRKMNDGEKRFGSEFRTLFKKAYETGVAQVVREREVEQASRDERQKHLDNQIEASRFLSRVEYQELGIASGTVIKPQFISEHEIAFPGTGQIIFHNLKTKTQQVVGFRTGKENEFIVSPDRTAGYVASGEPLGKETVITRIDLVKKTEIDTVTLPFAIRNFEKMNFSADGQWITAQGLNKAMVILRASDLSVVFEVPSRLVAEHGFRAQSLSQDGRYILGLRSKDQGHSLLIDTKTGEISEHPKQGMWGKIKTTLSKAGPERTWHAAEFVPGTTELMVVLENGALRKYDFVEGQFKPWSSKNIVADRMYLSPDGRTVALAVSVIQNVGRTLSKNESPFLVLDVATGEPVKIEGPQWPWSNVMARSEDGRTLVLYKDDFLTMYGGTQASTLLRPAEVAYLDLVTHSLFTVTLRNVMLRGSYPIMNREGTHYINPVSNRTLYSVY